MSSVSGHGRDLTLEEIMRPVPACVKPDGSAREALRVMIETDSTIVPVVDGDDQLIGFVSDGHLLASAIPKYLTMMEDLSFISEEDDSWVHYLAESADSLVSEVMSEDVASVEVGTSELEAVRIMVVEGVSSVLVTRDGKLVGVVGRLDLYAAIIDIERESG